MNVSVPPLLHAAGLKSPNATSNHWLAWSLLPILFSGSVLKAGGIFSIFGVDITVASVTVLVIAALWGLVNGARFPVVSMIPLVLMLIAVLFGLSMSESGEYQALKTRDFFFLTGVVVVAASIVIGGRVGMRSLVYVWIVAGGVAATSVLLVGGSDSLYGRFGIRDATLGPAYLSSVGLVAAMAAWGQRLVSWKFSIPIVALTGLALVGIGSRGPLLSAFAGMAAWLLLGTRLNWRVVFTGVAFCAAIVFGIRNAPDASISRLFSYRDLDRGRLWEVARKEFLDHPFRGVGWGNYSEVSWAVYPHNIFLEVAAELGALGLLALSILLLTAASNVWRNRRFPEVRILGAVAIVWFTGQQFSSDLTNRNFWLGVVPTLLIAEFRAGRRKSFSRRPVNDFASKI